MILLTGATGFIGTHLRAKLIEDFGRNNILVLSSKPIIDCNFILHNNYNFENDIFTKNGYEQIDTIIHAGAFTPKSTAEANDIPGSNSNIINTAKLIGANFTFLKRIIYLSAIDVYANSDLVITEESITSPISLYGYSKLFCEKMITEWAIQNNLVYQILRIGHIYGPGEQHYKKLIPLVIQQIIKGETLQIYGAGDENRTFLYITDVVDSIVKSLTLNESIGPVNIVGDNSISINDLVNKLVRLSGSKISINRIENSSKSRNLVFNNNKMKKYLLTPKINLDEGLLLEWNYMKTLIQ
jgi:nucleoside-diphosphate-sugar epimerase